MRHELKDRLVPTCSPNFSRRRTEGPGQAQQMVRPRGSGMISRLREGYPCEQSSPLFHLRGRHLPSPHLEYCRSCGCSPLPFYRIEAPEERARCLSEPQSLQEFVRYADAGGCCRKSTTTCACACCEVTLLSKNRQRRTNEVAAD